MISSDERTNTLSSTILSEIDFGGFEQGYESYKIEIISASHSGSVLNTNPYLYLVCNGLSDNGYFFRKKLNRSECVLGILPTTALVDSYLQSESGVSFKIINARLKRKITVYFLKPDFTPVVDTTDINVGGGITKWHITLKMTPIVDY
jgi:hypothetical protein